jgi:hypothetical protein
LKHDSISACQPLGSCPVTLCEMDFRQELCRALRSYEVRNSAEMLKAKPVRASVLRAREAGVLKC